MCVKLTTNRHSTNWLRGSRSTCLGVFKLVWRRLYTVFTVPKWVRSRKRWNVMNLESSRNPSPMQKGQRSQAWHHLDKYFHLGHSHTASRHSLLKELLEVLGWEIYDWKEQDINVGIWCTYLQQLCCTYHCMSANKNSRICATTAPSFAPYCLAIVRICVWKRKRGILFLILLHLKRLGLAYAPLMMSEPLDMATGASKSLL